MAEATQFQSYYDDDDNIDDTNSLAHFSPEKNYQLIKTRNFTHFFFPSKMSQLTKLIKLFNTIKPIKVVFQFKILLDPPFFANAKCYIKFPFFCSMKIIQDSHEASSRAKGPTNCKYRGYSREQVLSSIHKTPKTYSSEIFTFSKN